MHSYFDVSNLNAEYDATVLAGLGGYSGLGAINWWCWDEPGFRDCHDEEFAQAQQTCAAPAWNQAGYANYDDCVSAEADAATTRLCACAATAPSGGTVGSGDATDFPWGSYSAKTKELQSVTNDALNRYGYNTISNDGKLGPGTCGAVRKTLALMNIQRSAPSTCRSFTEPTKKSAGGGGTAPKLPGDLVTPPTIGAGMSGDTMWLVGGGLVAAVAVGAALYMRKTGKLRANPRGGRRRPRKNRRRR